MSPVERSPDDPLAAGSGAAALDGALSRVGDRWALLLVNALLAGPRRFGDLQGDVTGIAPTVLTQRLRHLERQGVVVAEVYSRRPPRFVYRLSAAGEELAGALRLLAHWGARRVEENPEGGRSSDPLRHARCGTSLEARWFCPTCEVAVDDPGPHDLRYL